MDYLSHVIFYLVVHQFESLGFCTDLCPGSLSVSSPSLPMFRKIRVRVSITFELFFQYVDVNRDKSTQ